MILKIGPLRRQRMGDGSIGKELPLQACSQYPCKIEKVNMVVYTYNAYNQEIGGFIASPWPSSLA